MKLEVLSTGDKSPTLYNSELDETYHSRHGARQESEHVYIKMGLEYFSNKPEISVFEMGFGTGLNVLLTWGFAQETGVKIDLTTVELYPLPQEIWTALHYAKNQEEQEVFEKLHVIPWEVKNKISETLNVTKIKGALMDIKIESKFDIIYFDAFGPDKQPQLWEPAVFERLYSWLNVGGVLVTYSAKGQVRRDMANAGFIMERLQGPPGKREMLRAVKK